MRTLVREDILARLQAAPPLVEGMRVVETQVQPHGVDLTVAQVFAFRGQGIVGFASDVTQLPPVTPVPLDDNGWWTLPQGAYRVRLAETVHLPLNVYAIARPRSSLLRMGVQVGTALWDAGYSGQGEALLVVQNPYGIRLQARARILQLVFFQLDTPPRQGYSGRYQGNRLPHPMHVEDRWHHAK